MIAINANDDGSGTAVIVKLAPVIEVIGVGKKGSARSKSPLVKEAVVRVTLCPAAKLKLTVPILIVENVELPLVASVPEAIVPGLRRLL